MTSATANPLVSDYLARLERAADVLPSDRRDDLLDDIEAHIAETLPASASEADTKLVLDRLGAPDAIVAAELPALPAKFVRRGAREWFTLVALLFGGVVIPFFGWAVGVVMLWASTTWRTGDKVVGTLLMPGGFAAAAGMLLYATTPSGTSCSSLQVYTTSGAVTKYQEHCTSDPSAGFHSGVVELLVVFTVLPLLGALYLAARARPHAVRAYPNGGSWIERRGPRETLTITLLLIGGIVLPVVGWLIGVALLWTSCAWSRRDRLVGTLLIPGGLAIPIAVLIASTTISTGGGHGDSSNGVTVDPGHSLVEVAAVALVAVASFVIPFVTAIYLSRRARPHEVHSRFGR